MELVFLSFFFFCSLVAAVLLFPRFHIDLFREGKPIKLRGWFSAILLTLVALACALMALFVMRYSSPWGLDMFFAVVFSAGWAVNALLLLPRSIHSKRIPLSLLAGGLAFLLAWLVPNSLMKNVWLAGSIWWVGPMVFRRFRLHLRYFLFGLIVFLVFDMINIYVLSSASSVIGAPLRFSGLISFGGNDIGIGDFFVGYIMINAAQYYFNSRKAALLLAFWFPLPLMLLRWVFPATAGMVFPYTMFLVPVALVVYLVSYRKQAHRGLVR